VEIKSPETNLVSQVTPLPTEFLDASSMMLASCAARRSGEKAGSFTVARWRGLPLTPEGPLLAFQPIGGGLPPVASRREEVAPAGDSMRGGAGEEASEPPSDAIAHAQVALAEGEIAFRGGRLEEASTHWQEASERAGAAGDATGESDALRGWAQAQQAQGEYAGSIARDPAREAAALGNLGNALVALREPERAQAYLSEAVEVARGADDPALVAGLLNNLGNHYAITGAYAKAQAAYQESAAGAHAAGDRLREAQAHANAARVALQQGRSEEAAELLIRARLRARALEASRDEIALLLHLASSYARLAELSPTHREEGMLLAHRALLEAATQARAQRDVHAYSYAQGNLGALYQMDERTQDALYLTRDALRAAEAAEAPDLLARWYGQAGQILWAAGQDAAALDAYRRAVDLVEETRPEMRARYGASDVEFQRQVEPVYLALVDALLQGAGRSNATQIQARLGEARETVERWKAAELRDYFRDECVAELEAQATPLEALSQTAAVVYPIQLADRLELLVSGPAGIRQYTVAVDAEQQTRTVRRLRKLLQKRTTLQFRRPAEQLYEWLVQPYADELASQGVDTLVFVPGGALRTIPMAALHDGEGFLMERFAVAVTPSLNLLAPKRLEPAQTRLLLAGVSEPVQGYPGLATVPRELAAVHDLYGGEVLLDADFQLGRLEEALREQHPGVVHLATHASFTGDPRTSFILTHDEKLSMDRLSELVSSGRFSEEPLELLLLSACSTAAGDDRAALGLSGVAIRAGARSALGSLWNVSDRASSELVVGFYQEMGNAGVSKAEALRRAQQRMLGSPGFEHPFYWASFMVINNWL
jgi:CHAT domain-containing protein